jgi:hypothetical protein
LRPTNIFHNHATRAHVGDSIWDEEWADLLVAALHEVLDTLLEHGQAAHAGADEHADARKVERVIRVGVVIGAQPGLLHGLLGCHHRVAQAVVIAPDVLRVHEAAPRGGGGRAKHGSGGRRNDT